MIPRSAVRATLGDMASVAAHLRPAHAGVHCELVLSTTQRSALHLQLRGYHEPQRPSAETPPLNQVLLADLLRLLRGGTDLVFANTISNVERFNAALRDHCDEQHLPNAFFAHHGLRASCAKSSSSACHEHTITASLPNYGSVPTPRCSSICRPRGRGCSRRSRTAQQRTGNKAVTQQSRRTAHAERHGRR